MLCNTSCTPVSAHIHLNMLTRAATELEMTKFLSNDEITTHADFLNDLSHVLLNIAK